MPEKADLESFIAAVRAQRERYDAGHLAYEAKLIVAAMGICVGICFALIGLKGWTE
jgi:hypothetical protein